VVIWAGLSGLTGQKKATRFFSVTGRYSYPVFDQRQECLGILVIENLNYTSPSWFETRQDIRESLMFYIGRGIGRYPAGNLSDGITIYYKQGRKLLVKNNRQQIYLSAV